MIIFKKKTFSIEKYFFTTKNSYAILTFVGAKEPIKTEYRGIIQWLVLRSPKPFMRVRILLPLLKKTHRLWSVSFFIN